MLNLIQIFMIVLLSLLVVDIALYITSIYKFGKKTIYTFKIIAGALFTILACLVFASKETFTTFNILIFTAIIVGGISEIVITIFQILDKVNVVKILTLTAFLVANVLYFVAFIELYIFHIAMLIFAIGLLGMLVVTYKYLKLSFDKFSVLVYVNSLTLTLALSQGLLSFINLGQVIVNYIPMLLGLLCFVSANILLLVNCFKEEKNKVLVCSYVGVFYMAKILLALTLFLSI